MTWSAPDPRVASVLERHLRESLSRESFVAVPAVVTIDTLRVSAPQGVTAEEISARVSSDIAGRLRERGVL